MTLNERLFINLTPQLVQPRSRLEVRVHKSTDLVVRQCRENQNMVQKLNWNEGNQLCLVLLVLVGCDRDLGSYIIILDTNCANTCPHHFSPHHMSLHEYNKCC